MGCTLSSSARPQMKSQRHTAFGHHSDSEFVDVVKLAPGSLEFWADRCSTGPPVQLRQTDEYPACSEIHGVMHADASRRDSVMWCFTCGVLRLRAQPQTCALLRLGLHFHLYQICFRISSGGSSQMSVNVGHFPVSYIWNAEASI